MARIKIKPARVFSILFVCTGNICRSPMAEYDLKAKLAAKGLQRVRVSSAGTIGGRIPNSPDEAVIAASRKGVNLGRHESRRLDQAMVDETDLIVAMDSDHKKKLLENFTGIKSKLVLLTDFRGDKLNGESIPDPYGLDQLF
ncbi:MAG: low molecular weight phosphotyrosine protein phosphatase, partial [Candidatus Competibacteraceae bacterium]|nr:low molecular weight phosphotyrosine protein phosphatase [Candidatus Competibacteraceae bacterium]